MTSSPICSARTSWFLPHCSSSTVRFSLILAIDTGRFPQAIRIPFSSFSRSYGSAVPSLFSTKIVAVWVLSNVVNRNPHFSHSRLRRMDFPSSVTRESITLEFSNSQAGHFIADRIIHFDSHCEKMP